MDELKGKIQKLISQNKQKEALAAFIEWSREEEKAVLEGDLNMLLGKLTEIKRNEMLGVLSFSESLRQQAIISKATLDFLTRAEAGDFVSSPIASSSAEAPFQKRKILFLASDPTNEAKLQLEKEFANISNQLQGATEQYHLVSEWSVTANDLQQAILRHKPNVLHFSGHGISGNEQDKGGILLRNPTGEAQVVSERALSNLFRLLIRRSPVELVILNSCYSEDQATGIAKHIKTVVGMSQKVLDETAIQFSTGFYRSLAEDSSDIVGAFEWAVNAVQLTQDLDLTEDEIPVIFQDGKLLDLS